MSPLHIEAEASIGLSIGHICNDRKVKSSFRNKNRKVSGIKFHPQVRVVLVPNSEDYKPDQLKHIWYSEEELHVIAESIRRTKLMMEGISPRANNSCDESQNCSSGFERRYEKVAQRKRWSRINSWEAVFAEQERQWDKEIFSPEAIREVYIKWSAACAKEALRRGQNVAKDLLGHGPSLCQPLSKDDVMKKMEKRFQKTGSFEAKNFPRLSQHDLMKRRPRSMGNVRATTSSSLFRVL